jgi:UNC-50 family
MLRYLRLFKFPQMDFDMAVWEMTHLLIAPKKVFKSIYYHKRMDLPQRTKYQTNKGCYRDEEHMA